MNNLELVHHEGRLIRGYYEREEGGRQLLCLLTAIASDPSVRPSTCPASVAATWLAYLLPWIDDAGSDERWTEHIERMIPIASKLHTLGRRAELKCRRIPVVAVRRLAPEMCDRVIALLDRAIGGDEPSQDEWAASVVETRAASWAASAASAAAASAAEAWAAEAWAAEAWASSASASASAAASASASAAASAAASASAADDMIAAIISVFEEELNMEKCDGY